MAALARTPKPHRALPIDPSPVAVVTEGKEFHFEVRRDRVAFIDLERLLEKAKADARLRLRMAQGSAPLGARPSGRSGRSRSSTRWAAPSPTRSASCSTRGPTYSLLGFEVIPVGDLRGETFDVGDPALVVDPDIGLGLGDDRPAAHHPRHRPAAAARAGEALRSCCSSRLAMVQPPFSGPTRFSFGDLRVGEEGLAEGRRAADQQDRPHLDARAVACRTARS